MNTEYGRVTAASEEDRRALFATTARRAGTTEQNIEEDFWVWWTLDALFSRAATGLRPRRAVSLDELGALSGKKQRARLDTTKEACQRYINDELHQQLVTVFADFPAALASRRLVGFRCLSARRTVSRGRLDLSILS